MKPFIELNNVANNSCGFKPDKTIQVPEITEKSGYKYETPPIKNKDRVGLIGFRVIQGRVNVVVRYHKANKWIVGLDLIIGVTNEAKDVCWRNPHHNTPDVRVKLEFLDSDTQISSFKIHLKND